MAREARAQAQIQGTQRWGSVAELLFAYCGSASEFSLAIRTIGIAAPWNVTFVADLVGRRLDELDATALPAVETAVRIHPGRWQFVLRRLVNGASPGTGLRAANLLETIGETSDIARLRTYAREQRRLPGASILGARSGPAD